jgi:hypothetical protein
VIQQGESNESWAGTPFETSAELAIGISLLEHLDVFLPKPSATTFHAGFMHDVNTHSTVGAE